METKASSIRRLWAGLALAAAALIAYLPALRAGFIWDDDTFLTNNPLIRSSDGLRQFWFTTQPADYWPVTSTSLWLEWRLWGMHAAGYHATNLLLHIACCLLLWAVLRRLGLPGAWLAALLFAVHPVNVESVAWIAERKNLLAMLFYLASFGSYLKSETTLSTPIRRSPNSEGGPPPVSRSGASTWYWLSVLSFVLAMLSKGSVATMPFVLLGIVLWRRKPDRRDAARLVPFFLVATVLSLVDVWFQGHGWAFAVSGASGLKRVLRAGAVVWFYLYKALVPLHLKFVYSSWDVRPADPLWWLPLLAALAVTGLFWRFRRSWSRPWLFGWSYFCAALLPAMGFTNVGFLQYTPVADCYEHLALIGVPALAACSWERLVAGVGDPGKRPASARPATSRPRRQFLQLVPAAAVVTLMGLTWTQCLIYRDAGTLYRATLAVSPDSWLAHNNLGLLLLHEGRLAEAKDHFEAALRINPECPEAHNNLGILLDQTGHGDEAIGQYAAAVRIRPGYAEAHSNLGNALRRSGRLAEAAAEYERSLVLDPNLAGAENGLGLTLAADGRVSEAMIHYQRALRLDPDFAQAHDSLGLVLAREGRMQEAIAQFRESLRLKPDYSQAHFDFGLALAQADRIPEAIAQFEEAVRFDPDNPEAQDNLGVALAKSGRTSEAIDHLEAAVRLRPDYAEARENLRLLLGAANPGN